MSWVTTADLTNVTGSIEDIVVLQAVLDDAEREITAYLKARGITASSGDACKTAEIKLAKAGLLELRIQKGQAIQASGEFVAGVDVTADVSNAARQLRRDAYTVLDDFLAVQSSLSTPRRTYVVKVN